MSILVNLLLLIEKIVNYSKIDIDKGNTPPIIYKICSCIRETFCMSYSIRKSNCLYLYFQKEHIIIKFVGKSLRFLGPDERSQALLLEKILHKMQEDINFKNGQWIKSTLGIYGRRFSFDAEFIDYYTSISNGKTYFILADTLNVELELEVQNLEENFPLIEENDFFIITTYDSVRKNKNIFNLFKELKNVKVSSLPNIESIGDKILYINFRKDQQNS